VKPRDCHERTGHNASAMLEPATILHLESPSLRHGTAEALATLNITGSRMPSIARSKPTWLVSTSLSRLPSYSIPNCLGPGNYRTQAKTQADRTDLRESKLDNVLFSGVYNLSARCASRERPLESCSDPAQALSNCSALSCLATTSSELFPSRLCDRCTASTSSANLLFA
jgi:hypothetical protein